MMCALADELLNWAHLTVMSSSNGKAIFVDLEYFWLSSEQEKGLSIFKISLETYFFVIQSVKKISLVSKFYYWLFRMANENSRQGLCIACPNPHFSIFLNFNEFISTDFWGRWMEISVSMLTDWVWYQRSLNMPDYRLN